jgi:hypothetical protein
MRSSALTDESPTEASILARVLGGEQGTLSVATARFILGREFSDSDKARMHELAIRNQDDLLSDEEIAELHAYARAGTVLSILKSTARRTLRDKGKNARR